MCIHMYYIYYILHTINIIYIHTFMYIHIYIECMREKMGEHFFKFELYYLYNTSHVEA